jgi:hypothetical protein
MVSYNRQTGQVGQASRDMVAQLGGLEKILKRKTAPSGDFQDQDLLNIKEHFRIVNQGFAQLKTGRTH